MIILPFVTIQPFNVGYNTLDTKAATLDIYGSQYVGVDNNPISIQDIKLPVEKCTDSGEMMMVYVPGVGYSYYYFYTDTIEDLSVPEEQWVSKGPGWATEEGEYADIELPVGSSYWLNTANGDSFTVSGQVSGEKVIPLNTVANTLAMYAYPFPVESSIQNIKLNVADCTDSGEMMMVYTPGAGYSYYYYYTDTIEDLSLPEDQWVSKGAGWATEEGEYADVVLGIGQGFWLNTSAAKQFTVASPLAK